MHVRFGNGVKQWKILRCYLWSLSWSVKNACARANIKVHAQCVNMTIFYAVPVGWNNEIYFEIEFSALNKIWTQFLTSKAKESEAMFYTKGMCHCKLFGVLKLIKTSKYIMKLIWCTIMTKKRKSKKEEKTVIKYVFIYLYSYEFQWNKMKSNS